MTSGWRGSSATPSRFLVSPFVSQVNRATGETLRQQAQEGLVPLKAWVKNALDHVILSA